jgi:hypothetical protein
METVYLTKDGDQILVGPRQAKSQAVLFHAQTSSPRHILVVPVKIWAVHFWKLSPALENHWTHWDVAKAMCVVVGYRDEARIRDMVLPGGVQWISLCTPEQTHVPVPPASSTSYLSCHIQ